MNLRSVSRFLAVAELGSLNKAAHRLNLSQPALSKSIQLLEEDLGVPLIDRTPRGISLTSYGESVFEHGRRISAEVRKLETEIEAIRTLSYGEVNVGAPLGPDSRNLAISILELIRNDRRITINVSSGTRGELIRPLLLGDLDFMITTLFEPDEMPQDIEQRELYLDFMTFAARPEHPILAEADLSLPKLREYPWIALSGNRGMEGALTTLLGSGFQRSLLRSGSPMFVKNILSRSDFIGLLRHDAASIELQNGTLVELDCSGIIKLMELLPPQKVGLIFRASRSLSNASQALIAEIERAI